MACKTNTVVATFKLPVTNQATIAVDVLPIILHEIVLTTTLTLWFRIQSE